MATIELQDVTRSFDKSTLFGSGTSGAIHLRGMDTPADRSFASRVATQADFQLAGRFGDSDKIPALDHVNLVVPDGTTMSVVGPSGCGKSTLLRVVAGLDTDFTGRVLYDGEDMLNVPPKDRYIGMVFQSYALYPHFKGQGNLSFFFKLHKFDDKAIEERIRITSQIMGIGFDALLDRKPGTLSGGQQQRLAIGRAIVRSPRLFLFDEPLSNLDAKLRVQTRLEIKRLLHRFGITALYVTHDQVEAIALSDQIAVMRAGRVEQVGDYATLRDHPATSFVAGFLGLPAMNLLSGGTIAEGALHVGNLVVPLPDRIRALVQVGQAVTLGVRPEAIRLVSSSSTGTGHVAGPGVRVRGLVDMIEPDYAHQSQIIYVRFGERAFAVVTELDAAIVGATVEVMLPLDQLFFFDATSEQSIG